MAIDMKAIHDSTHTLVMGVLNITEDSFSDGGLWLDPAKAKAHGEAMMKAGAISSTSAPNPLAPEPNASARKTSKPAY
mgnify:CR=1 FL=1